jgi:RNA polymerase-binding transcription factor DksA
MDTRTRLELAQQLRGRRAALLKQFFGAEADLLAIGEDREAELEERAQEDYAARVLARLDDRTLREVAGIDAALARMIAGTYGRCVDCGRAISLRRLHAVPTTAFCVDCAREEESVSAPGAVAIGPAHPGTLPADLKSLLDREVEQALRELVREDGRVDLDDVRLVCRHGVVRLEGAVPSEAEHRTLLKLVTDVAGCEDVVDHVRVSELFQEPAGRRRVPRRPPGPTEDVFESAERGLDYRAPDRPPPEED